jgi:hypothetical protein
LHDEARLDPMKLEPVVKARIRKLHERCRMERGVVGKEKEYDVAVCGPNAHLRLARPFTVFVYL